MAVAYRNHKRELKLDTTKVEWFLEIFNSFSQCCLNSDCRYLKCMNLSLLTSPSFIYDHSTCPKQTGLHHHKISIVDIYFYYMLMLISCLSLYSCIGNRWLVFVMSLHDLFTTPEISDRRPDTSPFQCWSQTPKGVCGPAYEQKQILCHFFCCLLHNLLIKEKCNLGS